jgi:WD40 repeat protein
VQALVPELSGDTEAIQELVRTDDSDAMVSAIGRWRAQHDQAVLVVDQFEELFTLNSPEVQTRFADLLARLALEADVHVLLSMRDDFLFHCQAHEALRPVFAEITPLGPPVGGALRRALVQPASKCGYRFENDDLVEDMLAEVEGERGLLPLLAFAVNRLWEERDREAGLLTREAYQRIGGVGGALARHAEETLEQIGEEREPMVRELFRNLMTAQGTRAVRDLDELLSVFESSDRESAAEVLRELVDARLLTTFEVESEGEEATHRVEIIHESLLSSWPRLVGWRTQDADAARLRDEVRQAARTWDEHERPNDLLWAGSAYREFASWRERYPGGLSETEESFARAMIAHVKRRLRRRRVAVAAVFAVLIAGLAVVGSFWRQSVRSARRAEAQKLIALGQLELESYPSSTVAHAIASLELADSRAARNLAQKALWKGPTALVVNDDDSSHAEFTPNTDWMVQSVDGTGTLRVIGKDGSSMALDPPDDWFRVNIDVNPTGEVLYSERWATVRARQHLVLWSIPDGRQLAEARYEAPAYLADGSWNEGRALVLVLELGKGNIDAVFFDGTIERLGSPDFDFEFVEWNRQTAMDLETGRWFGAIEDGAVSVIEIGKHGLSEPRVLGRHDGTGIRIAFHPRGSFIATSDDQGKIRLWDPSGGSPPMVVQGPPGIVMLGFAGDGSVLSAITKDEEKYFSWAWSIVPESSRFLRKIDLGKRGPGGWLWDASATRVARCGPDQRVRLWSLEAPADSEPLSLLRGDVGFQSMPRFHPSGSFLVTADTSGLTLWPLTQRFPAVIRRHEAAVTRVVFEPEGRWLASGGKDTTVRLWPLDGEVPAEGRVVFDGVVDVRGLAVSPDSSRLLVGGSGPPVFVPLDGQPTTNVGGFLQAPGVAFSADGQIAAVVGTKRDDKPGAVFIWEVGVWDQPLIIELEDQLVFGRPYEGPRILDDQRILTVGDSGLWLLDPTSGGNELIYPGAVGQFSVSEDERRIALVKLSESSFGASGRAILLDLEAETVTPFEKHGDQVWAIALDPTGTMVVTGDKDGVIRVGPATGEEPHLLLGHEGRIWSVAIDPLGRWIASGGDDTTVRLWPMPDLSKPPLHTLPREELIAKLKTLTNLRVVRDEESTTGWKLEAGPFPGWETVPEW